MTDERRASPDVAIARYLYRHEAEFAAGFLDDAGVPYRLQVDDAGVALARPAVLWVRAEDATEARELLDLDQVPTRATVPASPPPAPSVPVTRRAGPELSGPQRVLAAVLSALIGSFGLGMATSMTVTPVWAVTLGLAAAFTFVLALAGITGRAGSTLRGLLAWLTGAVP